MSATKKTQRTAGVGDDAVFKATGKTWKEWLAVLDRAGAKKMSHKEIVAVVREKHGIGPWWRQMVTVGYEQARGLRQKHEKPEGFSISRSKTMNVPVEKLFKAWSNARLRAQWLADPLRISTSTANKSLRIAWSADSTRVEVMFYPKGPEKTQMVVQHNKLPSAKKAASMKTFWTKAIKNLESMVA